MKKILVYLVSLAMIFTIFSVNVFATTGGWQANGGEVLSGKGGSYIITGGPSLGGGAFNKDHVSDLLADGIEEDLNVFVDVDGMSNGEYFEMSVSVKTEANIYKTEQVVMVQKSGDSAFVTGNGIIGNVEITESKIYNFKWNITKDDEGYIYATVTVTDLDGNLVGKLESDKLITNDSGLKAKFEEGDHLGYLWVLNVRTANGVHIYENVNAINNYEKNVWTVEDGEVVGDSGVYTIKGNSDTSVYNYANISKLLADGIEEKLNFFVNLDEMSNAELFETSVGIKNVKDEYKTEQVVMIQKTGDNKATISANGIADTIEIEGSRIYTLDWNFAVEQNEIKCVVNVYRDGEYLDQLKSSSLGTAASGDHLGYVWIFNTQVANGVHVYSELPEKPEVKFVNLNDSYYVGDEVEFQIATVNKGPQIMVKGVGELTGTDCITLQYKEGDNWKDFPSGETNFGPATGFPLQSVSSTFKAKFVKAGTSTYKISIVDMNNEEICSVEKTVTVKNKPTKTPAPSTESPSTTASASTSTYKAPNTSVR